MGNRSRHTAAAHLVVALMEHARPRRPHALHGAVGQRRGNLQRNRTLYATHYVSWNRNKNRSTAASEPRPQLGARNAAWRPCWPQAHPPAGAPAAHLSHPQPLSPWTTDPWCPSACCCRTASWCPQSCGRCRRHTQALQGREGGGGRSATCSEPTCALQRGTVCGGRAAAGCVHAAAAVQTLLSHPQERRTEEGRTART